MADGDAAVARARAVVGTRYRLHGRAPADGLDCVGLVSWALELEPVPSGYALRSGDEDRIAALIAATGLARADTPTDGARPGDLLMAQAGPGQVHLAIWAGDGVVHADAMLRRVTERPGAPPWPVLGYWRRVAWRA